MTVKSVLIACEGNICRSPMAEGLFNFNIHKDGLTMNVSSAGLNPVLNSPPNLYAQAVMKRHNIDISTCRAQYLTKKLISTADLVLVMTKQQLNFLKDYFFLAKGKFFLLGYWQNLEISDPIKQPYEIYEKIYHQIDLCWQDWKVRF